MCPPYGGLHTLRLVHQALKLGATGEGVVRAVAAGGDAKDSDADDLDRLKADDEFLALGEALVVGRRGCRVEGLPVPGGITEALTYRGRGAGKGKGAGARKAEGESEGE